MEAYLASNQGVAGSNPAVSKESKMKTYTAWGKDGYANTLIEGEGPVTVGNRPGTPLDEECPELIWMIEAESWEEACAKYRELQGWEPYKPMEFSIPPSEEVLKDRRESLSKCLGRPLTEEELKPLLGIPRKVSVKDDFSETPGGRTSEEGEHSGQEFLKRVLLPQFVQARIDAIQLEVNLDGTYGYSTGFLEEAFGGLARGEGKEEVEMRLKLVSTEEPYLVDDILDYIRQA